MKTLITGPDGQIGFELVANWPREHQVIALNSTELDLGDLAAIRKTLREIKPDLIVNAAGYTAVDRAEVEQERARAINAVAVGAIGEEARKLGAAVVHYSTDYVFDGRKRSPYATDDAPNPQSVYAQSKLEGEIALANSGAAHLIIRTSWIYGMRGRNFMLAILRQAALKPELRIVADQIGCPTWSGMVAKSTIDIVFKSLVGQTGGRSFGGREGLYHLSSGGSTNWFEFARRIIELAEVNKPPKLTPITTKEYGAPANRPAYSVLDCSRTAETFGVLIVDWSVVLEKLLIGHRAHLPEILSA
jgi:dTDP-4-dehydrorhamnose reductase